MSTIKLPELPSPLKEIAWLGGRPQDVYGRAEMIAYAEEAVRQALAAQPTEAVRNQALDDAEEAVVTLYESDEPVYLPDIALAIRALKAQPDKDDGDGDEPVAWQYFSIVDQDWCGCDPERVEALKKSGMRVRPLFGAPQASEYTSAMGDAAQAYMDSFPFAHKLPAEFRWADLWTAMYGASHAGAALRDADVSTLLAFIFERFRQPCNAGDLPDYVIAAVRRLELATLSAQPETRDG